jgi:hypothetical protein
VKGETYESTNLSEGDGGDWTDGKGWKRDTFSL